MVKGNFNVHNHPFSALADPCTTVDSNDGHINMYLKLPCSPFISMSDLCQREKLKQKLIKKYSKGERNARRIYERLNAKHNEIIATVAADIFRKGLLYKYNNPKTAEVTANRIFITPWKWPKQRNQHAS